MFLGYWATPRPLCFEGSHGDLRRFDLDLGDGVLLNSLCKN